MSLLALIWFGAYSPKPVEFLDLYQNEGEEAPLFPKNKSLSVLSWNIQYAAGMNYNPWYQHSTNSDRKPTKLSVYETLDKIAAVIKKIDSDVVLLQEVDINATRTYDINQVEVLLKKLPQYKHYSIAYYWKNSFNPHYKIRGKVGMALVVLSKYELKKATRYALPLFEDQDLITKHFYLKRAIQEVKMPTQSGETIVLLNTHLSAFSSENSTVMQKQVKTIKEHLEAIEKTGDRWLLGGDFNLLPPGQASITNKRVKIKIREALRGANKYKSERRLSMIDFSDIKQEKEPSEIHLLFDDFAVFPSLKAIKKNSQAMLTWKPNFSFDVGLTKTIDYVFYSKKWSLKKVGVLQKEGKNISDHMPVYVKVFIKE